MPPDEFRFSDALSGELSDVSVELERIEDLADGVARTLNKSFRSAIIDGRSFRSVLADIARSFSDIALKAALKPVTGLVGDVVGQVFSAGNPALANVTPFAKGGVIASPSFFPLSSSLGVAGEAGPEAVLPLRRGADGRLGVAADSQPAISINLNVQANDARSFVSSEAEISAMLLRAVRRGSRAS